MQAYSSSHPLTFQYQQRRPGSDWLPDAVTDTTAKRRRGARRLFGDGEGVLCRLLVTPHSQLYHAVVALPPDADFYFDVPALARIELERLFGDAPRYVRVARGRAAVQHGHGLVMLPDSFASPSAGQYGPLYLKKVQDDQHLQNLAEYFSRPSDERACRSKPEDLARYSREELQDQKLDASEFYLTARRAARGKRLPRRSWTSNLPRLNPLCRKTGVAVGPHSWRSSGPVQPYHCQVPREHLCQAVHLPAGASWNHRLFLPPALALRRLNTGVTARAPPSPWRERLRPTTAPSRLPVVLFPPGARPPTSSPDKATAGAAMR